MNVHKTLRSCAGLLLNILCTFKLRLVSTGWSQQFSFFFLWCSAVLRFCHEVTDKFAIFIQRNKKKTGTYCEVVSPRKILGFIYIASKYVAIFRFCHDVTDKFSIFAWFVSSSTVFTVFYNVLTLEYCLGWCKFYMFLWFWVKICLFMAFSSHFKLILVRIFKKCSNAHSPSS